MRKRPSALLTMALPAVVMGLAAPTRADVVPVCGPLGTPECSDRIDNDSDTRIDLADLQCTRPADASERFAGFQSPCRQIGILLPEQFLQVWPWPDPGCPECGITFLDWRDLLVISPDKIFGGVHPDWEITVAATLQQPIQGVFDDPNIPNVRVRYKGAQRIGPGAVGTVLRFAPDFFLTTNLRYVGRAWSANTGAQVINLGTLTPQLQ